MSNRVIDFKRDEWHTREKLAELLDISVRTLYRRIDDGEIQLKDTPEGKRYRVAPRTQEQEDATVATDVSGDKFATGGNETGQTVAGELLELIREQLEQVGELKNLRGRLEAQLDASQNDVTRAVGYVGDLEEELDALGEERAELHDDLQQERGRRLELEELNDGLRNELDVLTGMRAKYHLERGRREQTERERDELRDRLHTLQRELDALSHKLDDEEQRRLRLALGSLSLEIRKNQ